MLIDHLPLDGPFARWRKGDHWRDTEELLAQILDALNAGNWQRGGKGKRPKPVPRPGDQSTNRIGDPGPDPEMTLMYLESLKAG